MAVAFLLDNTYKDVHDLLCEAKNYIKFVLPGLRQHAKVQDRLAMTYHATRLTSRLLEMMSWLLAQRAVQKGEMSSEDATAMGFTITNDDICRFQEEEASEKLPDGLRILLKRSNDIYVRLGRLDAQMKWAVA
jgi:regulator of CtrA degradation